MERESRFEGAAGAAAVVLAIGAAGVVLWWTVTAVAGGSSLWRIALVDVVLGIGLYVASMVMAAVVGGVVALMPTHRGRHAA